MKSLVTILLIGLSVGLDNFAASVAIGIQGVDQSLRLRIALIFAFFETGMPIIGLVIGQSSAHYLGGHANLTSCFLLGLLGVYQIVNSFKETRRAHYDKSTLVVLGLTLSIDNLFIGFGLGAHHQPLLLTALVIGASSVCLSLLGLEIGQKLHQTVTEKSELLSGFILILVGILIGLRVL